jgi:gamma-glutamyl phosphate reductase
MTKETRPFITEHNTETDDYIYREMTVDEFEIHKAELAENEAFETAKAKAEADKAALLERLGLTEDELKTILG